MPTAGKKFRAAAARVDRNREHGLDEAVALVKAAAFAKFDETVDAAVRLGVDPRHADQVVRGTVVLPHGTGKSVRVLVVTQGDKAKEAEAAGADFVGFEFIQKLKDGWMDVARAVREIKAGKIEFRVDKHGNVHAPIGKVSFSADQLRDNLAAFLDTIVKAKPSAAKGTYLRSATISSTMGPGVRLDMAGYR